MAADSSGGETSDQNKSSAMSYSQKVLVNVRKSERLKRNILEIGLEYNDQHQPVSKDMVADTFAMLGINLKQHLEG